jgi:hypothetical protein
LNTNDTEFDNLYGSKYFGVNDVNGGRKRFQIGKVDIADMREKDGSLRQKYLVWFNGEDKALVLNKTNALALAQAYGKERHNWVGAVVELYSEMTGLGKPGVRLKPLRKGPMPSIPNAPATPNTGSNAHLNPPQWEPDTSYPDDFR